VGWPPSLHCALPILADRRHDNPVDQGRDHRPERSPHDDRYREVQDISPHREFFEFLNNAHRTSPFGLLRLAAEESGYERRNRWDASAAPSGGKSPFQHNWKILGEMAARGAQLLR